MAYPTDKPSGNYSLRDYDFATLDTNKLPMDEYLFKNGYKNADESEVESVPDAHNQNWLFDILHRNLRYTQQVAEENKNQLENKIATSTSIGQVKIGYGLNITTGGVLSVIKKVAEDANVVSYDLPIGSYMLWAGNGVPQYFVEPDGEKYSKIDYSELWKFAQDNNLVGTLFNECDEPEKFIITDIRGSFISIADSNEKVGVFNDIKYPTVTVPNTGWGQTGSATTTIPSGKLVVGSGHAEKAEDLESLRASKQSITAILSGGNAPANWGLKIILKALPTPPTNAVPIGTILNYTGNFDINSEEENIKLPDGYIMANGAELSRTDFERLELVMVLLHSLYLIC